MRVLNLIWRTALGLFSQAWFLARAVPATRKQRPRQFSLDALEVERLDRIRHPWKYRGK